MIRAFLFSFLILLWVSPAKADELRPVYIQLDQKTDTTWQLIWQASARSRLGQQGEVLLPENCAVEPYSISRTPADGIRRAAEVNCVGTILGERLGLLGLPRSSTDALVRVAPLDAGLITFRLTPNQPTAQIPKPGKSVINNVAWAYTVIGIEHIVFGFDHLLFVLSLVLLLSGWREIAWAVTAFTVSHSITLVGTTLGYFALPSRPVEAVIALSIVFLAAEIIKAQPSAPRLSQQYPWLVAFIFGLLHGFGFAGALAEIGLPENDRPLALLSFNIGVELGQLAVVAIALLVLAAVRRVAATALRPIALASAYAIGIVSTVWFIERVLPESVLWVL